MGRINYILCILFFLGSCALVRVPLKEALVAELLVSSLVSVEGEYGVSK